MTFNQDKGDKLNTDIAHIKVREHNFRQLVESSMDSIAKSQQEQDEQDKEKSSALQVETFYQSGQKLDEDQHNYRDNSVESEKKPTEDLM